MLALSLSCSINTKTITSNRLSRPSDYRCTAGKMRLSGLVLVSESAFYLAIRTLQWCLAWELISGKDMPTTGDRRVMDASVIGLQCSSEVPQEKLVLVSEIFAYQIKRSIDICRANKLSGPEEIDEQEV